MKNSVFETVFWAHCDIPLSVLKAAKLIHWLCYIQRFFKLFLFNFWGIYDKGVSELYLFCQIFTHTYIYIYLSGLPLPPTLLFSSCLAACLHGGCQIDDPEDTETNSTICTFMLLKVGQILQKWFSLMNYLIDLNHTVCHDYNDDESDESQQ